MTRFVRWSLIVAIFAAFFVVRSFSQAQQQQQPAPARQAAGPQPQAAAPSRPEGARGRPATAEELSRDTCWNRSPCYEDHRPPVAFKEVQTKGLGGSKSTTQWSETDAGLNVPICKKFAGVKGLE